MLSRENTVIITFIALAMVLSLPLAGLIRFLDGPTPPKWLPYVILIGVGVIAPILVNEHLNTIESP
ncbi:hypothetical protein [Haloquadratum walsbyi]|uniref:Uncharacterized protein n=1 Tax=Haloquadratum walsbyi J07HQW2 TaxID=1238425 RepID=U1NJ65_9EURY|nr:hypothetical protein [Haloquadratum walsbyi]ERG96963.1 MAG: hypothetical protein J07HQW2_03449 [Haloquadratum walsbyi J07HQW2]